MTPRKVCVLTHRILFGNIDDVETNVQVIHIISEFLRILSTLYM